MIATEELDRLWTKDQVDEIQVIRRHADQFAVQLRGTEPATLRNRVQEFAWNALRGDRDDQEFIESWFKIRTTDAKVPLVTIKFNYGQRILIKHIRRIEKEKKPVRIIILKARRLGFSTAVQCWLLNRVLKEPMFRAAVIAHDKAPAMELFEMSTRIVDYLPYTPVMKTDRRDEIQTGSGAKYTVVTANNDQVTRGLGVSWLHLSEFAFYENAETVHDAVMQTVSYKPGTGIIIESTANGMDNLFYELWVKAVRGENDWYPLFVPWHQGEENKIDVPLELQPMVIERMNDDERYGMQQYNLSVHQMAWLLWIRRNSCRNNNDIRAQEYPTYPDEAFLASGRPVFDQRRLEELRRKATPPYFQGHLVWSHGAGQYPQKLDNIVSQ